MEPPHVELPAKIVEALEIYGRDAGEVTRKVRQLARPQARLVTERVGSRPLSRGRAGRRLFGVSPPILGPLDSKFGGSPYAEEDQVRPGRRFFGQLNFDAMPETHLRGLLRIDRLDKPTPAAPLGVVTQWYPATPPQPERPYQVSACKWEASIRAEWGWSRPDDQRWFDLFPDHDDVWDMWNEWIPEGFLEIGEGHQLLGYAPAHGWPPKPVQEVATPTLAPTEDWRLLLRLDADPNAGFDWGRKRKGLYLFVPARDLANGDLRRVTVTSAKA